MGDLFAQWRGRIDVYSRRAVDVQMQASADFSRLASTTAARAAVLDWAVFIRRRTVALVAEDKPFTDADLAFVEAVGRSRAINGLSLASQRHALLLHTSLTLREVHEAARPQDLDDLMHTLGWLPPQGFAAQTAYTRGFLAGQQAVMPEVERVQQLAKMLVTDDPIAADMATDLAMPLPDRWVVMVARVRPGQMDRTEVLAALLKRHWLPVSWQEPGEFIALLPRHGQALELVQDFADSVGIPCAVGAAPGQTGELAAALAQAQQVSQAAPVQSVPSAVNYLTDLFAEVSAARIPPVNKWLHEVAQQLLAGPHLVTTLDSFYRNDMARTRTAAALNIHPRTLDYRLRRVQDLTGLDPVSVRGVRVLSTTVTRVLAIGTP